MKAEKQILIKSKNKARTRITQAEKYDHSAVEEKWNWVWNQIQLYKIDTIKSEKPYYNLMMFPYPSAEGLHVGNMYAFTGSDIFGRFKAMNGSSVFEPIGLDGFGIHSENYAFKTGRHPMDHAAITQENYYSQLHKIGAMYDWTKTVETYNPDYYKWTQWLFVQMFKHGLAYRKKASVNWCPGCKTVLADEQVIDGECERCGNTVEKRLLEQWFFKITAYAEKLLENIPSLDWAQIVKTAQTNWIGKSQGLKEKWQVKDTNLILETFTTWMHTTWGATFLVIAPEHPMVKKLVEGTRYKKQVLEFCDQLLKEKTNNRDDTEKQKQGLFTGRYAINPLTHEQMPVFVANFVVMEYGTGVVKGAPAHDERDFEFARKYRLPIRKVIDFDQELHIVVKKSFIAADFSDKLSKIGAYQKLVDADYFIVATQAQIIDQVVKLIQQALRKPEHYAQVDGKHKGIISNNGVISSPQNIRKFLDSYQIKDQVWVFEPDNYQFCYVGEGKMVNAGPYTGMNTQKARREITKLAVSQRYGETMFTYHLRDWLISRQRYWGPPIPMIKCAKCAEKKPFKVFIIHGTWGNGDQNWFSWLKSYLGTLGASVENPTLPDASLPDFEIRMKYFKDRFNGFIDENTIIIGHSSGAPTALHLAEIYKVKGVVLAAPVLYVDDAYYPDLVAGFNKQTADALVKLANRKVDLKQIKKNAGFIRTIFGQNDPYIPKDFQKKAAEMFGLENVTVLANYRHFSDSTGDPQEFTDILTYLPIHELTMPGWYPVPVAELPVILPRIEDYKPGDDGVAPLAKHAEFYKTTCPECGGEAVRETDVSDTFLDSSWYFLRYPSIKIADNQNFPDPQLEVGLYIKQNSQKASLNVNQTKDQRLEMRSAKILSSASKFPWDPEVTRRWLPVDMYTGGAEHSVLHLLYSRFVTMALKDMGYLNFEEPFKKFYAHGLVIKDGAKMSKSRGNVVNPDDYIKLYGADALRLYLMFMGPFNQGGDFRDSAMEGMSRWLNRVWRMAQKSIGSGDNGRGAGINKLEVSDKEQRVGGNLGSEKSGKNSRVIELSRALNQLINKVTNDIEKRRYNTAIAKMMEFTNMVASTTDSVEPGFGTLPIELLKKFLLILAPFAPFVTEELWQRGHGRADQKGIIAYKNPSIHRQEWPKYDPDALMADTVVVVIQVNGKTREQLELSADQCDERKFVEQAAYSKVLVKKWLSGKTVRNIIFVPGKLLNFVLSD
ncbi:hypothetical protein A2154_05340 [Candidatus Gottesmanbacteria bacterium RBG_16_43_7]|uniref:Leucine--tRNA ligase n=1 Tax=Candidatus Gottesmanbacteria bacterium RBG_16_43_7 TaxID=1798373 RepID=A0A1F5ZCA4_9BACT|nr:MAG: hypothetical protein A2154_05340 [Candidatus Gottesmanbacteria bacterium RBG_16_43_7]